MINKQIIELNNILKVKKNEIKVLSGEIENIEQAIETIKKFSIVNDKPVLLIAMRDASGSMGMWERKLSTEIYNQIFDILLSSYKEVKVRYAIHTTDACEVNKLTFLNSQECGGTRCSSVYQKCLEIIDEEQYKNFDIYVLHLTDGDNIGSDGKRCLDLASEVTNKSKMIMYGELLRTHYSSTLAYILKENLKIKVFTIREENEINSVVQNLFT